MSLNSTLKSLLTAFVFASLLFTVGCNHKDNEINATCFDEKLNQEEQRIDCGGPNCDPCPPTCDDGVLNQDEQYIDCGGPNCEPCGKCDDGVQSVNWDDATNSFVMEQGLDCGYPCTTPCPPTCEDGIQNGIETGIDCGGDCDNPCPQPTCNDGVWNGNETGVDCGGPDCAPCPVPTCNDGIQNQDETGIDCGGICGGDCPPPTCTDGIMNGNETGIDCGGTCPTNCPIEETCNDGVLNNSEEWIDCGGPNCPNVCPTCNDGVQNGPEAGADCVIGFENPEYAGGTCPQCETCYDGIPNNFETYVDCGGPNCEPCEMWLTATTLGSGGQLGYFEGENIQVQQQGFVIIITGTQTLGDVTRTLKVKVPTNIPEGGDDPITNWLTGPGVEYTNFDGTTFNTTNDSPGTMAITVHTSGFNPDHIEGTIDFTDMYEQIPGTGTSSVTGVSFFINY